MPTCTHPECTGVHDNNRYRELCPRSIELKRAKDRGYSLKHPDKIYEKGWQRYNNARIRQLQDLLGNDFAATIRNRSYVIRSGSSELNL